METPKGKSKSDNPPSAPEHSASGTEGLSEGLSEGGGVEGQRSTEREARSDAYGLADSLSKSKSPIKSKSPSKSEIIQSRTHLRDFFSRLNRSSLWWYGAWIGAISLVLVIGLLKWAKPRQIDESKMDSGSSGSDKTATLQTLPKQLETSSCDLVIVEDVIRQEFLSSTENSVRLRIYDCLDFTGRYVDRENFSKGSDRDDFRIYQKISDFLNGVKLIRNKSRGCSKFDMTANCFDMIQSEFGKKSKKIIDFIAANEKKNELFLAGFYLFQAQDALNRGNSKFFQKYLMEALQATPDFLTGLRSGILTWGQTKLLVSGEIQIVRQLNELQRKVLKNEKEIYAWAARFLYLYSYSEKREQLVSLAFSRVGAIQLVKNPVMLEILIPEAMKLGISRELLPQLDFMREFYQTNDGKETELGEKMIIWKARVLDFLREFALAEEMLSSWLKAGMPISSDFWFVRGTIATGRSHIKDAALFFKKADELGMPYWGLSWNQSLAAAQLGQKVQAQRFLTEFRRVTAIEVKEKEAWGLLLEAELSFWFRDDRSTYNAIKRYLRINPAHLRGWEILSETASRLGRRSESVKASMKVDELRGQLRYYVSDRYLYAPNGPLAGLR